MKEFCGFAGPQLFIVSYLFIMFVLVGIRKLLSNRHREDIRKYKMLKSKVYNKIATQEEQKEYLRLEEYLKETLRNFEARRYRYWLG